MVWNERDERDPLIAELVRVSKWDSLSAVSDRKGLLHHDRGQSGLFGPVVRRKFGFVQAVDRATFVDQVASRSYVQVLPEPEQAALLGRVADLAAGQDEPIPIPYVTDVFLGPAPRAAEAGLRSQTGERRQVGARCSTPRDGRAEGEARR